MKILSQFSVLEYLLFLKNNFNDSHVPEFIQELKKDNKALRTIKITSVVSVKRNVLFSIEFNGEQYILKHFLGKREPSLQDKSKKQETFKNFDTERYILKDKNFTSLIPEVNLIDNQSKTIIMKKLSNYGEFNVKKFKNDYYREFYLKKLGEITKSFSKIPSSTYFEKNNEKNFRMIGVLKNNPTLLDYYKKYVNDWKDSNLIHGDLYPRNILVNQNEKDIKIIDWEMATLGDPYFDLSIVVHGLFIMRLGLSFATIFYPNNPNVHGALREDIKWLETGYGETIINEKLKIFLIINSQWLSPDNKGVDNLIKNIEQIFP